MVPGRGKVYVVAAKELTTAHQNTRYIGIVCSFSFFPQNGKTVRQKALFLPGIFKLSTFLSFSVSILQAMHWASGHNILCHRLKLSSLSSDSYSSNGGKSLADIPEGQYNSALVVYG